MRELMHGEEVEEALQALAKRLAKRPGLREGLSPRRAGTTLHMLTGLEAFVELRREGGLSLEQTIETITELTVSVLRLDQRPWGG